MPKLLISVTRAMALAIAVFLSALSAPSGAQTTPDDYYDDARRYQFEGKRAEALIQLKNALQLDDRHVPSLLLMADLLLAEGSLGAAEDAYSESLLLGADPNRAVPRLAETLLLLGEHRRLLRDIRPDGLGTQARAEVHAFRSLAYRELGSRALADDELDQARRLAPATRIVRIAEAEEAMRRDDPERAVEISAGLVQDYERDAAVWSLRGTALAAADNPAAARLAFERAIEIDEQMATARLGRLSLAMADGDLDAATSDAEFMVERFPTDPRGPFFLAQLHDMRGEAEAAAARYREALELASAMGAERVASRQQFTLVLAVAALRSGAPTRAQDALNAYQLLHERDARTGALLARTLVQLDEGSRALQVLEPLLFDDPESRELRMLKAMALSARGDHDLAIVEWEKLRSAGDDSADLDAQIAREQVAAGDLRSALPALKRILEREPERVAERALYTRALLDAGQNDTALESADALLDLAPGNVEFRNLKALALLRTNDLAGARRELTAVQALQPSSTVAAALVEADLRAGAFHAARDRLLELNAQYPDDRTLLLQRAQVERAAGDLLQARRFAERAVDVAGGDVESSRELIRLMLADDDTEAALSLATSVARQSGRPLSGELLLAETLAAAGRRSDAAAQYKLIARREGLDHGDLYAVAQAQAKLGRLDEASATLQKASQQAPERLEYRGALVDIVLQGGDIESARERAQELVEEFPSDARAFWLLSRAAAAGGDTQAAVAAVENALAVDADHRASMDAYREHLYGAGRHAEAEALLSDWLARHPSDISARLRLAQVQETRGDTEAAVATLAEAASRHPENPVVLNNLAYLQHGLGRKEALATAQQAHERAPDRPDVNDTLGWILVSRGRSQEALPYLRSAVTRGSSPTRQYHLAVALSQLGRHREATEALEVALRSPRDFSERTAAQALLQRSKAAASERDQGTQVR